ncbi:uncharacterized protein [Asterias amurensis]|uniref:uncharacterized protein n=1 Tax=Asterias amurensis TaxID=7602 RepID=UPI003AB4516E
MIELIYVMGTEDVQKKMEGMVHNHKIWKAVSEQWLNSATTSGRTSSGGTGKSEKHNSSSGRGRQTFMIFDEMDNVLGHCPMPGVDNHAHLDSNSLALNDDNNDNNNCVHPEDDDESISSRGSINEESLVEDADDEDDEKVQVSTSKQPRRKRKIKKVKKSRDEIGEFEDTMALLIQLQVKLYKKRERRFLLAENRRRIERREREDRRRRWAQEQRRRRLENEQEDRRMMKNRMFMLLMVLWLRRPAYQQPNHANGWNGQG